ncbi:lipopolysaccharide biosynthesis protein [Stakelama sp. CBK3Z-3]|uniref:Lipopolysaccharide biosynthesis protein n=1 Tax=Stakelama flava TaxID=2860338 RepID=A0ABS6XPD6_9SPHN|nr:lipopolysaccharide biosynthesis protein [Stakelama flava]MBW4331290.1 lipopolysaccharide biosynthesis protein [Stakelama flava]
MPQGETNDDKDARRRTGLRAVLHNLGWLIANRGLVGLLSLVYLAIVARSLGVADFGRFALITGASKALATMVGFQTWQIVVQYGVTPLQARDDARLGRLFRACGLLDLGSALVGIVIGIAVLFLWGNDFGITASLMNETLLFLVVQLITIRSMPLGALRLQDRFAEAAIADSMTGVVRLAGAALVLLAGANVEHFLYAWAAAEAATAGAFWWMFARGGNWSLMWNARARPGDVIAENPGIVRFSLSTSGSSTLGLATKQLPLLLVGGFIGPAAAGIFRLAFQIANALTKLSQLLVRAGFPEIVRAVRKGSGKLARTIWRLFAGSTLAAGIIMALTVVIGRPVLMLVGGRDYLAAYPMLLWLTAAGCIELAAVSFEPLLMAGHRATTALAARCIGAVVLIGAMVALMPAHGGSGAATGVFIGSVTSVLLLGLATVHFGRSGAMASRGLQSGQGPS